VETERGAVPGSLDLLPGPPGRVYLLLVNVGLYMGVVLSEGVLLTALSLGRDGGAAALFGLLYALLSAPGLLVFAFALGFVPPAWPWRRKRLLALIGSIMLVGGWLLVASALTVGVGWFVWSCVLFGLVVFGFVSRIPLPNERSLG
jgi:hypothetical protein